VALSGSAAGE